MTTTEDWTNTGLLQNIEDKDMVAQCLSQQLEFNNTINSASFKRTSIPLLVRVFTGLQQRGIKVEPTANLLIANQIDESVEATRLMDVMEDSNFYHILEAEAEAVAITSETLVTVLVQKVGPSKILPFNHIEPNGNKVRILG